MIALATAVLTAIEAIALAILALYALIVLVMLCAVAVAAIGWVADFWREEREIRRKVAADFAALNERMEGEPDQ